MRDFRDIEAGVIERFGGEAELDKELTRPRSARALKKIPDSEWLSAASRAVFQAGFNWTVVRNKWPRIEEIFHGFDLHHCSFMPDDELESVMKQDGMIRHWAKTRAIRDNATFFLELSRAHNGLGNYFAGWQAADYGDNLRYLQKGGSRLGGRTGQIFLRRMGVDTLIFSPDMVQALVREGVVQKTPSSKKDWAALQKAVAGWQGQTGRSLNEISQILAYSVG
ncbi:MULTISPECIES: DNA-3-methyladenine glycosylase I [unclassified Microbulbifer]|uniref:DNA-3-methyladenine glycosylase I n=1 Tax=unclassified Microbulbifer TaxID=2619833 RepID=UPI001E3A16CB|nr:DNA-3-methyladenine glycosylase I [Microbulbifer sp. YPW16]UHQ54936.1 DNA-3-methyladenine glycosylase I [Microbulbifer sp. YPW16]